jgi:hypothetical protein
MKKIFFLVISVSLFLIGCNPKDSQPPLIFLIGENPQIVTLNSWWEDPGVTIDDNVDGEIPGTAVTVTHNIEFAVPAPNGSGITKLSGTYTVTYTIKDKAGNEATATRTVIVKNAADKYATKYYQYVIPTNCSIVVPDTLTVDLSVDARINNRVFFPKLGGKLNPQQNTIRVYGDIKGDHNDSIIIPPQKFAFWENGVRYLYSVSGILGESWVLDTIDPYIVVKYQLDKLKYDNQYGTVSWNDSLWSVAKNDVVIDRYERY